MITIDNLNEIQEIVFLPDLYHACHVLGVTHYQVIGSQIDGLQASFPTHWAP